MISEGFVGRAFAVAILACTSATTVAESRGALAPADDLAATGRESRARQVPILIAFTQASCSYCTRAKRDYLIPMQASAELRSMVIMRELDIDRQDSLRDFTGRPVSRADMARRYGVKRVPTVIVVDGEGTILSAPLVGLMAEDFYRLYLEQAIEEGLYKLRVARPAG